MVKSIQHLSKKLASATAESELRNYLMDSVSDYFGVHRWGLYLLDQNFNLASFDVVGVSNKFVDRYDEIGKAVDPVLKYVLEHHSPAHEELVLKPGTWKQSELYRRCCAEYDHEHIMTGPIVSDGNLVGTIHFARVGYTKPFTYQELANLGAVCLHFSACLVKLRSSYLIDSELLDSVHLTPREIQIANLVAKGLTNADVAKELWITRNTVKQYLKQIFKKLDVHSRTAMANKIKHITNS